MSTPNTNYYVYEHWRPDKNSCFYVGKGKGVRAFEMRWRKNKGHERVVSYLTAAKLKVVVKLIFSGISEKEAFLLEKEKIAYWRSIGVKLVNGTDGGEGVSGMRHRVDSIEAMRIKRTGVPCILERRKKISDKLKGRQYSPETIEKMRVSQQRRHRDNPGHLKAISAIALQTRWGNSEVLP